MELYHTANTKNKHISINMEGFLKRGIPAKTAETLARMGEESEMVPEPSSTPEPGSVEWIEMYIKELEPRLAAAIESDPSWYVETLQAEMDALKENLATMKKEGKGRRRSGRKTKRRSKKTRKH